MEKLKSEIAFLKAEKQFGIDLKTLSDGKQKMEEELKIVKAENDKLVVVNNSLQEELDKSNNQNQLLQQEIVNLKDTISSTTEKLKVSNMEFLKSKEELKHFNVSKKKLEAEKDRLEDLNKTSKCNVNEKKIMEGRLQNDKGFQEKVNTSYPVNHDNQTRKMVDVSEMVFENALFCCGYKKWFDKLHERTAL